MSVAPLRGFLPPAHREARIAAASLTTATVGGKLAGVKKKSSQLSAAPYDAKTALGEGLLYAADRWAKDFSGGDAPLSVILEIAVVAAVFRAGQERPTTDIEGLDDIIDDTMELVGRAASRPKLLRALSETETVVSAKAIIQKLLAD